jgi:hypothetical protein
MHVMIVMNFRAECRQGPRCFFFYSYIFYHFTVFCYAVRHAVYQRTICKLPAKPIFKLDMRIVNIISRIISPERSAA